MDPYFPFLQQMPWRKQWKDSLDMWDALSKTRKFLFSLLKVYQNECNFNTLIFWKTPHVLHLVPETAAPHSLLPATGRRNSRSIVFPLPVTLIQQKIGCSSESFWGSEDFQIFIPWGKLVSLLCSKAFPKYISLHHKQWNCSSFTSAEKIH